MIDQNKRNKKENILNRKKKGSKRLKVKESEKEKVIAARSRETETETDPVRRTVKRTDTETLTLRNSTWRMRKWREKERAIASSSQMLH